MCGVYGITYPDRDYIQRYIDVCKHRGPDGEDIWNDDHITLGHNLLSIQDKPAVSKQPWHTPKGNVLSYNGEIFNYPALCQKYKKTFTPKTTCDTELLAWGLENFGLEFIKEIDSMHGFAYYEPKKQLLTLSRDHAGIKPMYFAEIPGGLAFGSEIKGLFEKVPGARTIDTLAFSCLNMTGMNITDHTFFKGIKRLMAGETLTYDIKQKRFVGKQRYLIKPVSTQKFDAEAFREVARQSVRQCAIGLRKIGVFLSGGLDSSLVAYELKQYMGKVNSFTNRMNPGHIEGKEDYNEDSRVAWNMAREFGYNHHDVEITPKIVAKYWKDSIYYMEQPTYHPSLAMYCYTNKFLHDNDIVVTMAGDMGDEVLGGYPIYWKIHHGSRQRRLLNKDNMTSWRDVITLWTHRIKRQLHFRGEIQIKREDLIDHLLTIYPEDLWNKHDQLGSYMALDCVTQVPEDFFARNDKFGMAYGMEGRFPLATKKFMEHCMSIHSIQKIGTFKNMSKIMTQKAYVDRLPNYVLYKAKTGWTTPTQAWYSKGSPELKFLKQNNVINVDEVANHQRKAIIPAHVLDTWLKIYKMKI